MSTEHPEPDVTQRVTTSDGLGLAVYESGEPSDPTVVLVHGYPDDHTVWDGLVALLVPGHHVVTYDVRGAGESDAPRRTAGYRLPQLVADLEAVLDAVAPDEPVHLIAHDWGSIQCWEAVSEPRVAQRVLSFTSISGPSLDMAAAWLRGVREHPVATLWQLAGSSYIMAFQLPVLPEILVSRGLVGRLIEHSKRAGRAARPTARASTRRDELNGLGLYRANLLGRVARPAPRQVTVPCQVIAPEADAHVSSRLQREAPAPYVDHLLTHRVPGNHWVVEQSPELVAARFADFVRYAEHVTKPGH